tara:strand:+ start:1192 stop:2100 length:909 start_codon:yes stop_codon:yes gene_type:complete
MTKIKKKILVTGGNGFIGSNLINNLKKTDAEIHNLGRQKVSNVSVDNYFSIDITKTTEFDTLSESYDTIYHCAGSSNVQYSVSHPINDFEINALGALNILEYARRTRSKKFILLSTVSVYGKCNDLPLNESLIKKPISPYGASKLSAENYCHVYNNCFGMDTRIARIYNVYGPGLRRLFIADLINKIKSANEHIDIIGDGKQIRDYIYITDLINALIIIENKGLPGNDYDISSGNPIQLYQIIEMILKIMDKKNININYNNVRDLGDIKEWYGDPAKINKLGFKQKVDLYDGLKRTVTFHEN